MSFGFIVDWEKCNVYTRLIKYIQYVFTELQISFTRFDTIEQCERNERPLLIFLGFDALCQRYLNKKIPLPQLPNVKFIHVITEPDVNLKITEHYYKENQEWIYAILNFNMNQKELTSRIFPNSVQFTCFQGYTPNEDLKTISSSRPNDVLAAGFSDHSEDRRELVRELRNRGLTVIDTTLYGDDFDRAIQTCKVSICYPHGKDYNMWYGQRTLWPLNKQTCVVTIPSDDRVSEEFYDGLFINTTREKFIETVVNVIKSGEWQTFGPQAYAWFKHAYKGASVFDERFYLFCKDWTKK